MNENEITICDWNTSKDDLLTVRFAVFVDEQHVPIELELDEHDPNAIHILVRDSEKEPIATGRMLSDGHIGRMAVLKDYRDQGIGTEILKNFIGIAKTQNLENVFLDAQCNALGFYERLGFKAYGDIFDDAGIPHRAMKLALNQV